MCVKAADDSSDKFSGCYETNIDAQGMRYIDLPLPKTKELYSEINFTSDRLIDKVSVVELARNAVDTNLKIKEFGYNNVSASVEAPSDGVAVLMQSYYDGWKAWVDGKRVDIEVVDGCFIGIPVEEGSHKIELRFEPWDFKLGAGISLIYMGTFSAVIIYANKKNKLRL